MRALTGAALLSFSGGAAAATGAQGSFGLAAMVHTPNWPSADEQPWDGTSDGEFVYRAIPCAGNAPLNNISSNLPTYNSRIPGSRSPASTRAQPFRFKVVNRVMAGSISLIVCKLGPGPTNDGKLDTERDRITVDFHATADRRTDEETTFDGTFTITGSTGRYAQLTGSGTIHGYLMCFDPKGCAEGNQGRFRDMQFVLEGTFSDAAFNR